MKKIALIAAMGLMGMGSAMAQTATGGFNVDVTLVSQCRINTGYTTQTLNFGSYTSFGSAGTPAPTANVTFECTRGMAAPNVAFDAGTDRTSSVAAATASGEGVVAGLRYTLLAAAGTRAAGTAATTSIVGSADVWTYAITGAMAAGQAGAVPTGAQSQARQLTISY